MMFSTPEKANCETYAVRTVISFSFFFFYHFIVPTVIRLENPENLNLLSNWV